MNLQNIENFEQVTIKGKTVLVPYTIKVPDFQFIGRTHLIDKTLAALMSIDEAVFPQMCSYITGQFLISPDMKS